MNSLRHSKLDYVDDISNFDKFELVNFGRQIETSAQLDKGCLAILATIARYR